MQPVAVDTCSRFKSYVKSKGKVRVWKTGKDTLKENQIPIYFNNRPRSLPELFTLIRITKTEYDASADSIDLHQKGSLP